MAVLMLLNCYLCTNLYLRSMSSLQLYLVNILSQWGLAPDNVVLISRIVLIVAMLLIVVMAYYFCHKILVKIVRRITRSTAAKWDDHLLNDHVLNGVCHLLPPVILYVLLPLAFMDLPGTLDIISKACFIYIVIAVLKLVWAFISALYAISCEKEQTTSHPLKGIYQMLKLLVLAVSVIIIISIVVDKSPVAILTGLGAAAAILSLVFKDTILGLVAGVQLSANDMLKPGDWIVAERYGANGFVREVTLTTIKVQNWDMTITTIPPYALISDSFQNWRGMFDSKGRRVKRSLNIDISTIRFCTDEEQKQFEANGWLEGINDVPKDDAMVNLRVFRNYLERYLRNHPMVNNSMLLLVRQLQPTAQGLPLELYFFSARQDWVTYEKVQAAVFEHVLAVMPKFGLRVFQSPSGTDVQSLYNCKN